MRLVDLLTGILDAQAETLKRLAGILGEEELTDALERQDEVDFGKTFKLPYAVVGRAESFTEDIYRKLESTVHESGLSSMLQFYVWAFPVYRHWVESADSIGLVLTPEDASHAVEHTLAEALRWRMSLLAHLPNGDQIAVHLGPPWLRLRTRVLQSVGLRHVG